MRTNRNNSPTGTCNKCNDEKLSGSINSDSISCNDMDLNNLIMWNVSKALEKNPSLNLKINLTVAQEHLDQKARDGNIAISNCPTEQQHLVYALLAWQQLGHRDAESLFQFIESKKKKENKEEQVGCNTNDIKLNTNSLTVSSVNIQCNSFTNSSRIIGSLYGSGTCVNGPVVKLPVDTKIIMRLDNIPCKQPPSKTNITDTKLKSVCCMDSACAENLAAMDKATQELRARATSLAKREAERVELLERAETAWADLELGYQRRLRLANEKKDDLTRQIQKAVKDRNEFKEECGVLANELKRKGEVAEQQRVELRDLQKVVCQRACRRLALSEEASRGEAALAEEQCKMVQLDRDLQFKEEQARRKLTLIENETESACALMHDAERALRAELSGLRDQIKEVSDQLLEEDILSNRIKEELEVLRKEKEGLVEDLDGCKELCENKMQGLMDEALSKKEELEELKQKVLECRCKYPVDVEVEVKRTPSLAALCKCAPEDRLLESCSCTSLRSTLISSLLADLFSGLQSELTEAGLQMPCQLMKCLEDKHNWDRASVVKTNLRNFFTKLLVGELDIAIASAIENYHAKWIGASCADGPKLVPRYNDDSNEGWETRALERRAQQLATRLAEQLFEERAEELTKRAKEIVTMGPPPCECKSFEAKTNTKVMPCLVTPLTPFKHSQGPPYETQLDSLSSSATNNWKRASQDVTELKHQVKALKKETIKKEDLREMEENIAKIIKQVTEPEMEALLSENLNLPKNDHKLSTKVKSKEVKNIRNNITNEMPKTVLRNRIIKKKPLEMGIPRKCFPHDKPTKQPKKYNYSQDYSVNLCLCGHQGTKKTKPNAQSDADTQFSLQEKSSKNIVCEEVSAKMIKLTIPKLLQPNYDNNTVDVSDCISNCKCLQKKPSNKSIDQLLHKLAKWKCGLEDPNRKFLNKSKCNLSSKCLLNMALNNAICSESQKDSNTDILLKKVKEQVSTNNSKMVQRRSENENTNLSGNMFLAAHTESVYMADVNLDKSNEFSDKYMGTTESMKLPENKEDISKQCLINKSTKEEPKQSKNRLSYKIVHRMKSTHTHKNLGKDLKKFSGTDLKVLTNCKSTSFVASQNKENKSMIKETDNQTNKNFNKMNKADTLLNNFDYYINFLGVALADAEYTKMGIEDGQNKNMISPEISHDEYYLQDQEIHNIEVPKSIKEKNYQYEKENNTDMQYKAKKGKDNVAHEEFKKAIRKIINDQLKQKTKEQKDIALDSQSFEHKKISLNNCACCSSLKDTVKDLEVNTFDLLDNHLKEKFNEFKKYTCKSSCIAPEEAEKIFSKILKKVKQVISDCANSAKVNEGVVLLNDGSWKRVYGLLQEYLKVKLKRVKCLPFVNDDKDGILPHVLENVSNLIEQDFQRLKDLCKCQKDDNAHTKTVLSINEELPEKDINITKDNYCNTIFKPLSILNSYTSAVFINTTSSQVTPNLEPVTKACDAVVGTNSVGTLLKQNVSSQVSPNLVMVTKSCDVMVIDDQSKEITEINLSSLTKPAEQFIYNDCNCNVNKTKTNRNIYDLLGKKDVLVNLYADVLINSNCVSPDNHILHNLTDHLCYKSIEISKSLPDFGILDSIKKSIVVSKREINHTTKPTDIPLVGCTVECLCDNNFTSHACKKTVIQDYNRLSNNWIQLIENNKKSIKDLSYIMNGSRNNNNNCVNSSMIDTTICGLTSTKEEQDSSCATETKLDSDDEIILVRYNEKSNNSHHQTTNTFDENGSFIGDCESTLSQDWYECKSNKSEIRSSTHKFSNSYTHNTIDKIVKYSKSDATVCTDNCHCSKVPICHVKMLVNHIEQNVMNSQCTCDVMSTVCPVHF